MSNQTLVQNSSSYTFTDKEIHLLEKGLNYCIRPNDENETLFLDIETNLKYCKENEKSRIKHDLLMYTKNEKVTQDFKYVVDKNAIKS